MVFRYFTLLPCVIVFQAIDSVVLSYVNLRVKESAFFLKSNRLRLVQITRRWDSQRVCFLSYILRTNRNAHARSWIHSHVCPRIVGLITARDRANAFMYTYVWYYTSVLANGQCMGVYYRLSACVLLNGESELREIITIIRNARGARATMLITFTTCVDK